MNSKILLTAGAAICAVGISVYLLKTGAQHSPNSGSGTPGSISAEGGGTSVVMRSGLAESVGGSTSSPKAKGQVADKQNSSVTDSTAGRASASVAPAELETTPPEGERTFAKVVIDGKERNMSPNDIGHFPRVYVQANQAIPVEVSFPDGRPDDPVVIQVEDGGGIDGKLPAKLDKLDAGRKIAFKFQTSENLGIYRVVLRKDSDLRVLDFWVGDEQPIAKR